MVRGGRSGGIFFEAVINHLHARSGERTFKAFGEGAIICDVADHRELGLSKGNASATARILVASGTSLFR
jgi:hypothetical protein